VGYDGKADEELKKKRSVLVVLSRMITNSMVVGCWLLVVTCCLLVATPHVIDACI
jgi:hypothetical protein